MIAIDYRGRLGNNMVQYAAARLLADYKQQPVVSAPRRTYKRTDEPTCVSKIESVDWEILLTDPITHYDHKYNTQTIDNIISSYHKGAKNSQVTVVTDDNYSSMMRSNELTEDYILHGWFQQPELFITHRDVILSYFKRPARKQHADDVFVHYRLGDLLEWDKKIEKPVGHHTIPVSYYDAALSSLSFSSGYLSTDSPDHSTVKFLCKKHNLRLYQNDAVNTLDFARCFNKLVLSHGTYSYWMGYLSDAEHIKLPLEYMSQPWKDMCEFTS